MTIWAEMRRQDFDSREPLTLFDAPPAPLQSTGDDLLSLIPQEDDMTEPTTTTVGALRADQAPEVPTYPRPMASFLAIAQAVLREDRRPREVSEVGNSLILSWVGMASGVTAAGRVYDMAWALYADLEAKAITCVYCPAPAMLEVVFDPNTLDGDRFPVETD